MDVHSVHKAQPKYLTLSPLNRGLCPGTRLSPLRNIVKRLRMSETIHVLTSHFIACFGAAFSNGKSTLLRKRQVLRTGLVLKRRISCSAPACLFFSGIEILLFVPFSAPHFPTPSLHHLLCLSSPISIPPSPLSFPPFHLPLIPTSSANSSLTLPLPSSPPPPSCQSRHCR